jgi:hypothetical protein
MRIRGCKLKKQEQIQEEEKTIQVKKRRKKFETFSRSFDIISVEKMVEYIKEGDAITIYMDEKKVEEVYGGFRKLLHDIIRDYGIAGELLGMKDNILSYGKVKFTARNDLEFCEMLGEDDNDFSLRNYLFDLVKLEPSYIPFDMMDMFKPHIWARQRLCKIEVDNCIKYDINSSHAAAMYSSDFDWCVYYGTEVMEDYNGGGIESGYYFLEVQPMFPFFGDSWYSAPLVDYYLKTGLIAKEQIRKYLRPSSLIGKDVFQKPIVEMREKMGDKAKKAERILSGYLGKRRTTYSRTVVTQCDDDLRAYENVRNIYIKRKEGDMEAHEITKSVTEKKNECHVPIYCQILDLQAMMLLNIIMESGGVPAYVHADSVTLNRVKRKFVIDGKLGGVKEEELKDYQLKDNEEYGDDKELMDEEDKYKTWYFKLREERRKEWTNKEIRVTEDGTEDYDIAEKVLNSRDFVLVTGDAGVGKTSFLTRMKEKWEKEGLKVMTMSFTNTASMKVGGNTLHKAFGVSFKDMNGGSTMLKEVKDANIWIIDEVYMVPVFFVRFFLWGMENGKRIIYSGDDKQLKAIGDGIEDMTKLVTDKIVLKRQWRYSVEDDTTIKKIISEKTFKYLKSGDKLHGICYYNKTRKEINSKSSERFISMNPGKRVLELKEDSSVEWSQHIRICEGMPVIAYEKGQIGEETFHNGQLGIITKIYLELTVGVGIKDIIEVSFYDKDGKGKGKAPFRTDQFVKHLVMGS